MSTAATIGVTSQQSRFAADRAEAGLRCDDQLSAVTDRRLLVPEKRSRVDLAATLFGMERFEVRVDAQLDDDNVMLTLSGSSWLLNVNASPEDWARDLVRVAGADHARRLDVCLGTSARRPVWWSMNDGQLTLCVGQDSESYDFVVVLPAALLREIQAQIDAIDPNDWG